MKRTKTINLDRMRRYLVPAALVVAVSFALSGCSFSDQVVVNTYQDVNACIREHPAAQDECERQYQHALAEAERTAPRYRSLADCQAEFGSNMCRSSSDSGYFMPMMAGFALARMMDSRPLFTSGNAYSPMYGGYYDGAGSRYGAYTRSGKTRLSKRQVTAKPKVSRTLSRGGFGAQAVAKSSWESRSRSGSSSRSRFSWGG